jgi:hypothetical protein
MLSRVDLVRTNVSEELSASFVRVTRNSELGTTLAVTRNRRTLRRNTKLLVTANVLPSSPILVTLMVEALSSSETSALTRAAQRNIPEDAILHSHCCKNLKSSNVVPSSQILVTLMMEALSSSETSARTRATRRSIPEDVILQQDGTCNYSIFTFGRYKDVTMEGDVIPDMRFVAAVAWANIPRAWGVGAGAQGHRGPVLLVQSVSYHSA